MKTLLILFLLSFSLSGFSQEDSADITSEEQNIYQEENYEDEMFAQKQEEYDYPTTPLMENPDDYQVEEEVYDSEADY